MRRAQTQLPAAAILDLEHLLAVRLPSPGELPGLGQHQDRHPDLLGTGRVHLFPDDGLGLRQRPEPQRQPRVDPRHQLADVRRPQQQAMRRHLRLGGCLAKGPGEQLRRAHSESQDTK